VLFVFFLLFPVTKRRSGEVIIIMDGKARGKDLEAVQSKLIQEGFTVHVSKGTARTVIGAIGENT
jgi:3-deoxy-7-phosphoheptulonate synthase